ncbi:MAG: MATE family efflux transporter [Candidatus Latescibacterota bacterium]
MPASSPSTNRQILAIAVPVALSSQVDTLVGMADIFIVSRLGADAISAVGMARLFTMVLGVVMVSATTGAFAMVAQHIGGGRVREASATVKQAFTLVVLITGSLSIVGWFGARLCLESMSPAPAVVELGTAYLRIYFAGMFILSLNYAISTCFYGTGDARTPLYVNVATSLVKVGTTYVLVLGPFGLPAWGVPGAAAGNLFGGVCGLALGFGLLYSGRFRMRLLPETSYRLDPDLARHILRIGIPSALQGLFRNGSSLIFAKLIALTTAGTAAVAAYSIGSQVERLLRRTSLAFGTAATTLVGNNLGAGEQQAAANRGAAANRLGVFAMILCALPVVVFARPFMELFTDVPEVIGIGVIYLWAVALAEPLHVSGDHRWRRPARRRGQQAGALLHDRRPVGRAPAVGISAGLSPRPSGTRPVDRPRASQCRAGAAHVAQVPPGPVAAARNLTRRFSPLAEPTVVAATTPASCR